MPRHRPQHSQRIQAKAHAPTASKTAAKLTSIAEALNARPAFTATHAAPAQIAGASSARRDIAFPAEQQPIARAGWPAMTARACGQPWMLVKAKTPKARANQPWTRASHPSPARSMQPWDRARTALHAHRPRPAAAAFASTAFAATAPAREPALPAISKNSWACAPRFPLATIPTRNAAGKSAMETALAAIAKSAENAAKQAVNAKVVFAGAASAAAQTAAGPTRIAQQVLASESC